MLHLLNFRKRYPGAPAPVLTIPDLRLAPGLHWLRGPNGAGKTTLFRAVAGLLPAEGEIWLADDKLELHRDPVAYRRLVNYGEAEPLYPDYLSAHELAAFVADAKRAPAGQLDALAEALGITAFWKNRLGTYSSGMLKKSSLVIALLGQPRLVLLDEPLITLDAAAVRAMGELVRQYRAGGTSFLISSHQDFQDADLQPDYRWQLAEGTLVTD